MQYLFNNLIINRLFLFLVITRLQFGGTIVALITLIMWFIEYEAGVDMELCCLFSENCVFV